MNHLLAFALLASRSIADPPAIDHQPVQCTTPGFPFTVCATVTDDVQVASVRAYFRPAGDKYYSYVDMVFGGVSYCGTLPAARERKVKAVEYYVQAVDDELEAQRTSTYQIAVLPEAACEFPPVEKDAARLREIVVHATSQKQGAKLSHAFLAGPTVTFVPVGPVRGGSQ